MLSKIGEIRRDESCLDYAGSDVILYPCHGSKGNQYWNYDHKVSIDETIFHVKSTIKYAVGISMYSNIVSRLKVGGYTNNCTKNK